MPPQPQNSWFQFESFVANVYRQLGAEKVIQNYSLAGTQIDVYVEEKTKSGQKVRTYVECKYYKALVGVQVVRQLAVTTEFLKAAGQIDKSVLVAYIGFSTEAHVAAQSVGIDLITFSDLEQKLVKKVDESILQRIDDEVKAIEEPKAFNKTVFVMMPFDNEMNDLYIYGIRGCAEKLGLQCVRVDELEFNSEIINEIKDYIEKSQILIGVMTNANPNVYYEVGIAHGKNKEVILLTNNSGKIPFDVNQLNHIIYSSINDLERKLTKRLEKVVGK